MLKGYEDFLKTDQANREAIIAPPRAVLENWFSQGVTYGHSLLSQQMGFLEYNNEPDELHGLLEIACGKITSNILKYLNVPEYLWSQLTMFSSTIPLCQLGGKGEIKATFDWKVNGIPYRPVFLTEDKPPVERAALIGNSWYNLQAKRFYNLWSKRYRTKRDEYKQPETRAAVERVLEDHAFLKEIGLSLPDRIEIINSRLGLENSENAEMLRHITGTKREPDAVKKSVQRHRALLKKFKEKDINS